ncbi:MAG: DNA polymerase III subunit gamma/tau, partial [Chloroflexota bacterium]|nr:DNA polymerase III subunit gamma/tau [Chloroflexota bacterium]
MAYVSLYRKYRPQTFADVVGQDHVTTTLSHAVTNDHLHHAYLFTGPRGTGKTSTARILAKAINCEKGPRPDPCGECMQCESITQGSSVDVIEIDAASHNGVEDVRDLRDRVAFAPAAARKKLYIVDECHMLTPQAWNAFLKTVEEPPGHVIFVFATTEPHKVLETILSRTQRF